VLFKLAIARFQSQNYTGALEALDRLEKEYGSSPLTSLSSLSAMRSLPQELRARILAEKSWAEDHTADRPEVDTSRTALLETDKGGVWIGFYPDLSPKHVENFVTRAKAGEFNGVSFYLVRPKNYVEFGGETSKDDDPLNDGEPESEATLEPEDGRYRLEHLRGALSSVATEKGESAERFAIVTSPFKAAELEKRQTVFGKVLMDRGLGMAALDDIQNVETYATTTNPDLRADPLYTGIPNHPLETVRIHRVSIWSGDDAIEEGHEWDTSEVKKPEPAEKETPGEGEAGGGPEDGHDDHDHEDHDGHDQEEDDEK
jgi:cyclophilin family peptidyl-prolyl cis-trans isomerase